MNDFHSPFRPGRRLNESELQDESPLVTKRQKKKEANHLDLMNSFAFKKKHSKSKQPKQIKNRTFFFCLPCLKMSEALTKEEINKLPLKRNWTLYVIPTARDDKKPIVPQKITDIHTFGDFFSIMNSFEKQQLHHQGTWYFMQDGFFPLWENCPEGGRWDFKFTTTMDRSALWRECCLGLIGEYLVQDNTGGLLGVELQGFQPLKLRLKLWTKGENFYPTFSPSFPMKLETPCYSENKVKVNPFQTTKAVPVPSKKRWK